MTAELNLIVFLCVVVGTLAVTVFELLRRFRRQEITLDQLMQQLDNSGAGVFERLQERPVMSITERRYQDFDGRPGTSATDEMARKAFDSTLEALRIVSGLVDTETLRKAYEWGVDVQTPGAPKASQPLAEAEPDA